MEIILKPTGKAMEAIIKETWKSIYREWFGLEKDFSNFYIPKHYDLNKNFSIIVPRELSISSCVDGIAKKNLLNSYSTNLDERIIRNNRTSQNGDYIVLFKKNIEADEEFKNFSANQLEAVYHNGITLMERLLLGVLYFYETKKQLDVVNKTLCSGSRDLCGNVPLVYYYEGIEIDWYGINGSSPDLRSRVVIL